MVSDIQKLRPELLELSDAEFERREAELELARQERARRKAEAERAGKLAEGIAATDDAVKAITKLHKLGFLSEKNIAHFSDKSGKFMPHLVLRAPRA